MDTLETVPDDNAEPAPLESPRVAAPRTCLGIALVAAVAVMIIYRRGLSFSPDAWMYWASSVSLLAGDGYCDLFGTPIDAWPPLYPAVLALVQSVTGVSVFGITLASAALVFAAVLSWHSLFAWLAVRHGAGRNDVVLATSWVALALVYHVRGLRSESLLYVILPLTVWGALRAGAARSSRELWCGVAWSMIGLVAGLATRQSSIMLVPALGAVLLVAAGRPLRSRVFAAAVVGGLCAAAAWCIETLLHSAGAGTSSTTRVIGWGVGTYSPLKYTGQILRGVGGNLGQSWIGLGLFVWLLRLGHRPPVARHLFLFTGVALACLFALFNLTPIADQLRGRFTLFAALLVVGNGLLALRGEVDGWRKWLLLGLLFGLPAASVGKHLIRGRGPATTDLSAKAIEVFVPANAMIDKGHLNKPALKIGRKVVVSPPVFPWMKK